LRVAARGRVLRAKYGEDFVGVGDPRFLKNRVVRFSPQLGHGPHEAVPIQELMMAAILRLFEGGVVSIPVQARQVTEFCRTTCVREWLAPNISRRDG
jgi:hypothetical protein